MKNKWKILLINSKSSDPNYYICLQIKNALKRHSNVECVVLADYSNATSIVQTDSFNLLFVYGGENINRPVIQILKNACGRSIVWFTEDPYELSNNIHNSKLFDLVFTNDPGSVAKYPQKAFFLPLASSKEFHYCEIPQDDSRYRYDLSFIGTAWPNRTQFINTLLKEKPELRYKLALPSNEHLPDVKLSIPKSEINWRTPNTELAKIANYSKFSLILHREFSSSGNEAKAESPGPRLFEIAMAGGLLLVDDSLEINSELFTPGKEYLPFKNMQECLAHIDYYKDKADERKEIIAAAQQRAMQFHTYDQRIDSLLEITDANLEDQQKVVHNQNRRSRLLIVMHNVINIQPFGGVEVYVDSVVQKLKQKYEIFFYVPDRLHGNHKTYSILDAEYKKVEDFRFDYPISEDWLSEPERERSFFELLVKYKIDVVHYHHLLNHVPSLPLISKTLGLKNIISIHDYYYICDSFNLLDFKNEYCDVRNRCIESCDICASKRAGYVSGTVQKRRAFFQRILNSADVIIGYSNTTKSYHESVFKGLDDLKVIPLPAPAERGFSPVDKQTEKFKIAILGNFAPHKGADLYLDIFRNMVDENVEFHIYGKMNDHYQQVLDRLSLKNVVIHKSYQVSELKNLLKDMNLSLHLSVWPETFLLTLSEAWMNYLIPIVSDIGALGERVTDGENGFVVPVNDSGAVIRAIRRVIGDKKLYESVLNNISAMQLTELDEHVRVMEEIYETPLMDRADIKSEQAGLCLNGLSTGLVCSQLVKHSSPPELLQIQRDGLKQKMKKAYRFYRSNGAKRTCKRVLAEFAKGL